MSQVLPGTSYDQGMALANRVHREGRAIVWTGHREPAEHYRAELEARGLTMALLER